MTPPLPSFGSLVRVRQRTYLVEGVTAAEGASSVVKLACVDDDAQGQRTSVVWDVEVDAQVLSSETSILKPDSRMEDPHTFAAYLHALRWACVTSTDPTLFQAPLRAGIVPKNYQLEPLRKALALPRVNLFIADDVGLGKTIEAGLVLQELLLRQRVQKVVVACPASVVLQWRDELSQRFGLTFTLFDKAYVNAKRRERGFGVNSWTTHRHFIISHSLLRSEDYQKGLRAWLGEFSPGSLLILDEAHVAAPSSESKYAIDSKTTRAIRDIAKRFEHRLFLSATPHNGHSNSFSALLEILDPQRFTRGVPVRGSSALKPVMVRRLKGELRKRINSDLPERNVVPIELKDLPADTPELVLAEKLSEYTDLLEHRFAGAGNRDRAAAKLVGISLQKRLLSSVEAFGRTLAVHRNTQERNQAAHPVQVDLGLSDEDDPEDSSTEEVARASEHARLAGDARAQALLDEMASIAGKALGLADAKVRAFAEWMRTNQCPGLVLPWDAKGAGSRKAKAVPEWTRRRVIIFTEYADTKRYLVELLESLIAGSSGAEERILSLQGGMDEEDREQVKEAFNRADHPVRILVATDAAREGINLQAQCADLFHFDLPWNPARLEQRNGRIDRLLAFEDSVRCHYFLYTQRPEDDVLAALVRKTGVIHKQLGSLADVIAERLFKQMKEGIRRKDSAWQAKAIDAEEGEAQSERAQTARDELEEARDAELGSQLGELEKLYAKAQEHLDFKAERLHDVVNLGLELAGLPSLMPRTSPPGSYDVPPLEKVAGTDATWREILDLLRAPRTRKGSLQEWRADNPPRPVSFEPATTLASKTVQLHLQHRLTQRALAQFRAQAFSEDRLSRITAVVDPGHARKMVLAIGRLSLYGEGASRLHEELLVTGAFWDEAKGAEHLQPLEESEEDRLFETLSAALDGKARLPTERILKMLLASAPADEQHLWKGIVKRAMVRERKAEALLEKRATAEAKEMQRILEVHAGAIDKELEKRRTQAASPQASQLPLPGVPAEKAQSEQYEADTRNMEKQRRALVEVELKREPERIRQQYAVKHQRLERVGLVYLWPATS